MKYIQDILKGGAIGIANVIPGFSGGTMAVILKVYERLINALSDIIHHPLKVLKDVWALLIGVVLGIVLASYTIVLALKSFPMQTIMFFVGLIIGSIPTIFSQIKNIDKNSKFKLEVKDIIAFIICVGIMIVLPIIRPSTEVTTLNFGVFVVILLMGVVSAAAMVIPGISGSLILMVLGYYMLIIGNIKEFISNFLHMNFNGTLNSFLILIVFALGAVLGLVLVSKLIKYLLSKYRKTVYIAIMGLLIASVFSIIYTTVKEYSNIDFTSVWLYVISILTLIIGGVLAVVMSIYNDKISKKKE